ncbi:MAG: hypothetical protein ACPGR2_06425 [Psychrobium sp.]
MKYFSSFKMSFILAASLVIVANTSVIKRAEGSVVAASSVGAAQGERKKVADIQFADKKFARCVRDMGRTYVKDLFAIHCNDREISDVSGIEQLAALRIAHLHRNNLTSINMKGNKHLIALYASNNQLTSVNVSRNLKLKRLLLHSNHLFDLDVTNNPQLEILNVGDNDLRALRLYKNHALKQLAASDNRLKKLKVHRSPELVILKADNNEIGELDLSNNMALEYVSIIDNGMASLKGIKSRNLSVLRTIYNPLHFINVSKSSELKELSFNRAAKCRGEKCQIATHERPRLSDIDFSDGNLEHCIAESYPNARYVDQITQLDCSLRGITETDGLEQLTALSSLIMRNNMITEIDTRQMSMLEELSLLHNELKFVNVTKNAKLTRLTVGSNRIKKLNVSHNPKLKQLLANDNNLKLLNLANNTELTSLFLLNNPLPSVELAANNSLMDIRLAPTTVCHGDICPTHFVKGQAGENGSISPTKNYITHGHTAQFVISPDFGYAIAQLTSVGCDGTLQGRIFTTTQISGFCAVYVGFGRVDVASIKFSDENLRNCIVEQHGADTLVENIKEISCAKRGIVSTDGLEHFTNLTQLILSANQISEIDVSALLNLTWLTLLNNQLTSLDISNNRRLERLTLGKNSLSTLDTSNNDRLGSLLLNDNPISELDLSKNFSLMRLFALRTNLTSLDLSNNSLIKELKIDDQVTCEGDACDKR